MNNYVVYIHKNKLNGKVYVGVSIDINRRWKNNGYEYKPKSCEKQNRPFWNAICKYGWDGFDHIIIEENLTKEEAFDLEIKLIEEYKSRDKRYGYNVAIGGNGGKIYKNHPRGMLGKHHSEEKKIKQAELMRKLYEQGKVGNTWKSGHPRGMLGKKHTEENKKRIAKTLKEKKVNYKEITAIMPNKEIVVYDSSKSAMSDLGISKWVLNKLIKSGDPYVLSNSVSNNREHLKTLEGLILYYNNEKQKIA